jgi:hypothetical protein
MLFDPLEEQFHINRFDDEWKWRTEKHGLPIANIDYREEQTAGESPKGHKR